MSVPAASDLRTDFDPPIVAAPLVAPAEGAGTIWAAAVGHLVAGDESWNVLSWLLHQGAHPYDVGRFARLHHVMAPDLPTKNCTPGERKALLGGYASELPSGASSLPRYPHFDGGARQRLEVVDPFSARLSEMAWDIFEAANDPEQLFQFGSDKAWVKADSAGPPVIEEVRKGEFVFLHHRLIEWGLWMEDKRGGELVWVEKEPPSRIVYDMLADPHAPFPSLTGVRSAPVFGPDGRMSATRGYDKASGYFVWAPDLDLSFVPAYPSARDITAARHILETELLGDFPFKDEASRAHAIAAVLHPFVRPMVTGPTPIHFIDKPKAGTGGTLLANVISIVGLGQSPTVLAIGKLEDEWRFRLLAILRSGASVVLLDNANTRLDSGTLAAVVTAPDTFSDRLIRSSEMVTVPVRCLWLLTANNGQLSHELARRCVLIRMDTDEERPEDRTDFRHPALEQWAKANRAMLVWAALVLIQAWVAAGRPAGANSKGSFESWAATIGGIFDVVGIPGFLENTDDLRDQADDEDERWSGLVEAWADQFGESEVTAAQLNGLAQEHLDFGEASGRSLSTQWGTMLRGKRDSVFAGFKITACGKRQHAQVWRLKPVKVR